MSRFIYSTITLLLLFSGSAQAQKFDTTTLFAQDAWQVNLTYAKQTGTLWCEAATANKRGQSFSVVAYDDGTVRAFVMDPSWRLTKRDVRYRIDIDYDQWNIIGYAEGRGVSVLLNGQAGAKKFVTELMLASAVATYNDDGTRLATFSLDGSYAAIGALFDCWGKILNKTPAAGGTDPFLRTADPF